MRALSLTAVLVGGVVDVVATNVVSIPVFAVAAVRAGVTGGAQPEVTRAVLATYQASPGLWLAGLLLGCACSVFAGWLAARIARRGEILNGALASWLCVGLGIYGLARGHLTVPAWQATLEFALSPALGALGGWLRLLQTRTPAEPPAGTPALS